MITDYINQIITLSVITISIFHCNIEKWVIKKSRSKSCDKGTCQSNKFDHINQMITLSVITIRVFY